MEFENKNQLQKTFNQIKGNVLELNDGEKYCSLTLECGHENKRQVNFTCKKNEFDEICKTTKLGNRVSIIFYPTSRKKENRWYNSLNILSVENA